MNSLQHLPHSQVHSMVLRQQMKDGGAEICSRACYSIFFRGSAYGVLKMVDIYGKDKQKVVQKIVSDGLDICSAIASVILLENEALKNGWKIEDRSPARRADGIETAARRHGVERLLIDSGTARAPLSRSVL